MDYKYVIYKLGKVTQIIMNRPDKMNALSNIMSRELEDAFDRAAADEECRVIVHSGAGRCFTVGQDVGSPEARLFADGTTIEQFAEQNHISLEAAECRFTKEHRYYAHDMKVNKWRHIPKPTIAMVHGYCLHGGFYSAATLDLIFASEDAMFLPPRDGQSNEGPWDLSTRKVKELLFEHRLLPAREAYECGFVSRIYPDRDKLEKETLAYAERVADNDLITYVHLIKRITNNTMDVYGYTAATKAKDDMVFPGGKPLPMTEAEQKSMRESKGNARIPRALANLKAKLESEKA